MSAPKGRAVTRAEMENELRQKSEQAAEAYKAAKDPKKRIEAIVAYAQALKDLSSFIMDNILPEEEKELEKSQDNENNASESS